MSAEQFLEAIGYLDECLMGEWTAHFGREAQPSRLFVDIMVKARLEYIERTGIVGRLASSGVSEIRRTRKKRWRCYFATESEHRLVEQLVHWHYEQNSIPHVDGWGWRSYYKKGGGGGLEL